MCGHPTVLETRLHKRVILIYNPSAGKLGHLGWETCGPHNVAEL